MRPWKWSEQGQHHEPPAKEVRQTHPRRKARVMDNTPRRPAAQAPTASSASNVVTVIDFRTREQWLTAFRAAALQAEYTQTDILVAVTLAQTFHCKKKTCAPEDGYDGIAKQIGAGVRTVKESARKMAADGFCIRHPGGRYETIKFTLTIPAPMSADMPALMEQAKPAAMSAKNGIHECQLSASHISTEVVQRDSAAPPRAVSPADRPVSSKLDAVDADDPDLIDFDPPGERAWRRSRSHQEASYLLTASST
jgi:hypothetical protein